MGSNTPDPATDPAADDTFSFDPDTLRAAAHPEMPREQTELGRALAAGIRAGDHIFVDTTCYGVPGVRRCRVTGLSPGTAAVYPIKFEVPGRGEGQCKLSEVAGHDPPPPPAARMGRGGDGAGSLVVGLMGELTLSEDGRPLSLAEAVTRSREKAAMVAAKREAVERELDADAVSYALHVARQVSRDVLGFELDWTIVTQVRDGVRVAMAEWDGVRVEADRKRLFIVRFCPEGHVLRFGVDSGDVLAAAVERADAAYCDQCERDRAPADPPSRPPARWPSCAPQERALLDALLDTVRLYTEAMR